MIINYFIPSGISLERHLHANRPSNRKKYCPSFTFRIERDRRKRNGGEVNVMRDDIANNTLSREEGLLNAPSKVGKYFGVPKVIE